MGSVERKVRTVVKRAIRWHKGLALVIALSLALAGGAVVWTQSRAQAQSSSDVPLYPFVSVGVNSGPDTFLYVSVLNLSGTTVTPAINLFTPNQSDIPTTFAPGMNDDVMVIMVEPTPCGASLPPGVQACAQSPGAISWILGQTQNLMSVSCSGYPLTCTDNGASIPIVSAQGPPGPQGPPGGTATFTQVARTVTVQPGLRELAHDPRGQDENGHRMPVVTESLSCPSGDTVISGGYALTNQGEDRPGTVLGSYPSDSATWTIVIEPSFRSSATYEIYANCATS